MRPVERDELLDRRRSSRRVVRPRPIADQLVLSPWTVQDHLKSVYETAGVCRRSDLGAFVAVRVASAASAT